MYTASNIEKMENIIDDWAHIQRFILNCLQKLWRSSLDNNIPFKILLVNNVLIHHGLIGDHHLSIKRIFLLLITIFFSLEADWFFVTVVHIYYLKRLLSEEVATTEENTKKTWEKILKCYNIHKCVKKSAWLIKLSLRYICMTSGKNRNFCISLMDFWRMWKFQRSTRLWLNR